MSASDVDDLVAAALRGEIALTPEVRDLVLEAFAKLVLDDVLRRRAEANAARDEIVRNRTFQEQKERDRQTRIRERKRRRRGPPAS